MNRLYFSVTIVIIILVTTGIGIGVSIALAARAPYSSMEGLIVNKAQEEVSFASPMPTSLPDLEYIPRYPGATIIAARDKSYRERILRYQTTADTATVTAFYKDALGEKGWVQPDNGNSRNYLDNYIRKDPTGSLAWHLQLRLSISPLDSGGSDVVIEYGRYPDIEQNLPVYPGAKQIVITREDGPHGRAALERYPTYTILKTYLVAASPYEIETYYNDTMEEYGWMYGMGKDGPIRTSTDPEEGLYFRGNRWGSKDDTGISYHLFLTATPDVDDQTRVQLKVIVRETGWGF